MNTHETESFNLMMMLKVDMKPIDCWDIKAPDDFENHKPCEDSKKW